MRLLICSIFVLILFSSKGQSLKAITWDEKTKTIMNFISADGNQISPKEITPVFSYEVDKRQFNSANNSEKVKSEITGESDVNRGFKAILKFTNISKDTIFLRNVVPLGATSNHVFITGKGEHPLSRTHLFIPGKIPVNVIVPDNAWELGYSGLSLTSSMSVAALTRRDLTTLKNATRKRFETVILPGGSVSYNFYADFFNGEWQNGLKKMFQERFLYDVETFDSTLYNREDLKWIRKSYVMHLIMAWDKEYRDDGKFQLQNFAKRGQKLYGGDDVIGLWPTWPTLGLDQRNQFDLFRDLPGGTSQLKILSDSLRVSGTKFFVCYNPWDESTRSEGHLSGIADLIKETSADGVVLDTRGESSKELQAAADQVKKGVIMYSEGMAVPKHMPGIVSGRVHNALYYPPMLNLNKLIKPDFAIFRVAEVYKEPIRREFATAFFNGYGTEINQFAPGHPSWEEDQYKYLGRTSRILRENTLNFTSKKITPLIKTLRDSVWVNRWENEDKTLYTIYSIVPEGINTPLFEVEKTDNFHFVDLWHHDEPELTNISGRMHVRVKVNSFDKSDLGTNNEGEVSCIARFPKILNAVLDGDELTINSTLQGNVRVWRGDPSYDKTPLELFSQQSKIQLSENFERYEGKIVIQFFIDNILKDEVFVNIIPGTPRLISKTKKTTTSKDIPVNMVKIPSGKFVFRTTHGDEFIPYPKWNDGRTYEMNSFLMDKFPVTNIEFKNFLDASKYTPSDTNNFLRHWKGKKIPKGEERFPVVYISWEDAQAYAAWAGKRIPTEIEWQYAAQTQALNEWPWKQLKPVTRKEEQVTETLTVTSIEGIDNKNANLGDGKLYPVGKYSKGVNPFGLFDLSGCVWQMTNDLYQSGSYRYVILKGGSYFKPSSSWWYVQGGPRELHYRQFLLRVSEGFERNATAGFRCIKDSE